MSVKIKGERTLQEYAPSRRFVPGRGYTTVRRQVGLRNDMEGLIQSLIRLNVIHEIDPIDNSPLAEVRWEIPSVDDGSDESEVASIASDWDFKASDFELSIMEHPKSVALERRRLGVLQGIKQVAEYAASIANPQEDIQFEWVPLGLGSAQLEQWAEELYEHFLRGVDKFLTDELTLLHTLTTTRGLSIYVDMSNTGKIYTTAQLQAAEPSIDPIIVPQMPAGYWLKKRPEISGSSNGTRKITRQWLHVEDFSTYLYDAI